MKKKVTLLLVIFCLSITGKIQASEVNYPLLGASEQWLHLLHYHKTGFSVRSSSQVDAQEFFLAEQGKIDPIAELRATVESLIHPQQFGDDSIYCRFPARAQWIKQQLPELSIPAMRCEKFNRWFSEINGGGLTVVFPAAYLNSPSSMYGHTLIRVNKKNGGSPLLDYVVNFAANAPQGDNELLFAYKGLTGRYPGVVSILPYYKKINEYSFIESRDMWEYQLDVSQAEVDQFLRHIWEVNDAYFDYYFFTENCSYQLLALIDAASARFDLTDEFVMRAIPSDTVRALVNSGAVRKTDYRPSTLTSLQHKVGSVSAEQLAVARQLVYDEKFNATPLQISSERESAQTLEVAYGYSRYLALKKKRNSDEAGKRSIEILNARSSYAVTEVFTELPTPRYRDDQGHKTRRVSLGTGYDGEQNYLDLGIRMAFHDLLDPVNGYLGNAQLEMFNLELRGFTDHGAISELQVQQVRLVDIMSLSPRDALLKPVSWRVRAGARRLFDTKPLTSYLRVGFGYSYAIGEGITGYGLVDTEADVSSHLKDGYHLASGPVAGFLLQRSDWSVNAELKSLADWGGEKFSAQHAKVGVARHFEQFQLRLEANTYDSKHAHDSGAKFSAHYYF